MKMFILLFWRYKRMNTSRFYFPARKAMIITVAFLIICLSFLWIALKFGFGLNIISGTFYRQGVSLLEGQVILPVFFVFLSVLVGAGLQKRIIFAEKRRNQYAIIIEIMIPLCICL